MTINNANTDYYKYYAQPTNVYKKTTSFEKVATADLSRGDEYAKTKITNLSEKAIALGKPESKASQRSDAIVEDNRTFKFKDSVVSKDEEALIKQIMQQLVADALISHAAIIRSSHETKGGRPDSAK